MADFDALFDLGVENEFINTIIEIPKGSVNKIEYERDKKVMVLDRVEPGIFAKPANYGFIPRTTDEDGDPLDTLVITDEPLPTGVALKAKVIGVMNFVDDGENDHKIICVPEDDRHTGNAIASFEDLPARLKEQIEHHFMHYKDLKKPGTTVVEGFADAAAAWTVIMDCAKRYSG